MWITVAEGARNSLVEGSVKRAGEKTVMQHCSVTLWASERVDDGMCVWWWRWGARRRGKNRKGRVEWGGGEGGRRGRGRDGSR